ncbi:MAG TPA: FAD-dependent oxidoreductase [Xanthobacteraceae bacterium]|jgi:thioredoxin reductase (NADPH)
MKDFDLVVIGAGVAGLTAAMFAGRHGLAVMVVDRMGVGGQIINAEKIDNWPGFPQGIGGHELGPLLHQQAEAAGAEIVLDTIEAIGLAGEHRIVRGTDDTLRARAVIIAAGSTARALGIPGEAQFRGKGVSHCAACDGALFTGREVCVVGGGDTALDEALVLADHAARVTVIHRGPRLDAQKALRDQIAGNRKIELVPDTVVEEILGQNAVSGVRLRSGNGARVHALDGVFVAVGLVPNTDFVRGLLALDAAGHIETDANMRTSVEGIFAAGDIRKFSVALLAAAAGDGATAAISAVRYLERGR